ncbi:MAG TPA: hypothetical protein VJV79_37710 [Polyangiaceae bacterium]|nr:hypothetical protein [Polyangiaceae bacterium]
MKRIPARRLISVLLPVSALAVVLTASELASAQTMPVPERSAGWDSATKIMALSSAGLVMIMPRIFYSDPEVTAGWKARWHVSVLAPTMTLAAFTLLNEVSLKDSFASYRPGCSAENQGLPGCESYGMFSSPSFLAGSAFGQGTGIFLVDTFKWSGGRVNGGALVGDVAVPLVLSVLTAVGRGSGNWETGGQAWGSAGLGLGAGLGMGVLYALLQRPECGYSGNMICW